MNTVKIDRISDAVTLKTFTDPRFKTMKLSVNMLTPISEENASKYALLTSLVSRATKQYPDFTSLSARLEELYGAALNPAVMKLGEYQVLRLSAGGIASRYAFGGEDMFSELFKLLSQMLFDPLKDSEGLFPEDGFLQEKRQLLEMKEAEFNDKVTYAGQRCEEILFEGESAGVNRCGSKASVEALRREDLTDVWERLLSSSKFEIFVLGNCELDLKLLKESFSNLGKALELGTLTYKEPKGIKRVTEEQPVTQSKLSMAFRADMKPEERLLFSLVSMVLGGSPSSKFFQNIREKMSLCYYCSSSLSSVPKTLYVRSGVETENLEKTEKAVFDQLKALQNGDLTEDELLFAKLAIQNSFRSVGDSLNAIEGWYLARSFDDETQTPEQAAEILMSYTAEDVVNAARRLKPAVVYRLKGSDSRA